MAPPAPLTARHLGRATLARHGLLELVAEAERVLGLLEPDARRSVELARSA